MINLIPSTGGIFDIQLGETMIFSKKDLDRYPEKDEVEDLIREALK